MNESPPFLEKTMDGLGGVIWKEGGRHKKLRGLAAEGPVAATAQLVGDRHHRGIWPRLILSVVLCTEQADCCRSDRWWGQLNLAGGMAALWQLLEKLVAAGATVGIMWLVSHSAPWSKGDVSFLAAGTQTVAAKTAPIRFSAFLTICWPLSWQR